VEERFGWLVSDPVTPGDVASKDFVDRFLLYDYAERDQGDAELLRYLQDKRASTDPVLSLHALFALATLRQREVYPDLIRELESSPNGYVRGYAAIGLGWLGDPSAIPVLEAARGDDLVDASAGDVHLSFVRESARAALIELGVPETP
jgi:HEAT repeat protein